MSTMAYFCFGTHIQEQDDRNLPHLTWWKIATPLANFAKVFIQGIHYWGFWGDNTATTNLIEQTLTML